MLSILLLLVIVGTFFYGIYIIFKGELGVKHGNILKGMPARIMGALYMLSGPASFIPVIFLYAYLYYIGANLDQFEEKYAFVNVIILAASLMIVLFLVNNLSNYLFRRQSPASDNGP